MSKILNINDAHPIQKLGARCATNELAINNIADRLMNLTQVLQSAIVMYNRAFEDLKVDLKAIAVKLQEEAEAQATASQPETPAPEEPKSA